MTKLTISSRDILTIAVLRHRFEAEVNELVAAKRDFAETVYNDVYSKSAREKMSSLPDGWLPTSQSISAQFGDGSRYDTMNFSGGVYGLLSKVLTKQSDDRVFKLVTSRHCHGCAKVYPTDHKLSVRYTALKAREDDLKSRIKAAESQAKVALHNVTTVGALIKAWPEIEPFTRKLSGVVAKLPAIPTSELNKTFKLPAEKIAA